MFLEEQLNTLPLPIRTGEWPFERNNTTLLHVKLSDLDE